MKYCCPYILYIRVYLVQNVYSPFWPSVSGFSAHLSLAQPYYLIPYALTYISTYGHTCEHLTSHMYV